MRLDHIVVPPPGAAGSSSLSPPCVPWGAACLAAPLALPDVPPISCCGNRLPHLEKSRRCIQSSLRWLRKILAYSGWFATVKIDTDRHGTPAATPRVVQSQCFLCRFESAESGSATTRGLALHHRLHRSHVYVVALYPHLNQICPVSSFTFLSMSLMSLVLLDCISVMMRTNVLPATIAST